MLRPVAAVAAALVLAAAGIAPVVVPPVMAQPFPTVAPRASTSYVAGYTPAQVRRAYGLDQLKSSGAGRSVAVIVAYGSPTIQSDLTTFSKQFGLPAISLSIAYPQGKPTATDAGWAMETALDVQWAHAIAPGAAIQLVVARSAAFGDLISAVDYAASHGAQVVSMSWGAAEFSAEPAFDSHFARPGVRFVAASGDRGNGVSWPAVSPNVIAVGGTSLRLKPDGSYGSESAWAGSGGGISAYEPAPAYQKNFAIAGRRSVPDVALVADPNTGVAVYTATPYGGQTGWFLVGGTSAGAPMWAALLALTQPGSNGALYSLAGSAYAGDYHDVTSGSNGTCGAICTAKTGYDAVTGLGSPQANRLVPALGAV